MKYKIEQWPKNKVLSIKDLGEYQIELRENGRKYVYKKERTCRCCAFKQSIQEFYIKDKKTNRRSTKCRDCELKDRGVLNIGKLRFADHLFDKGFRVCGICSETKVISDFSKNKSGPRGYQSYCFKCSAEHVKKYQTEQRLTLGDHYVKQYGKLKGIKKFNKDIIEELRNEMIKNRKDKFFVDDKAFSSLRDFARYIEKEYKLPISTTEKRISAGKTEEECKISEFEARSIASKNNWKKRNKL